jgi:hypothetical protein
MNWSTGRLTFRKPAKAQSLYSFPKNMWVASSIMLMLRKQNWVALGISQEGPSLPYILGYPILDLYSPHVQEALR